MVKGPFAGSSKQASLPLAPYHLRAKSDDDDDDNDYDQQRDHSNLRQAWSDDELRLNQDATARESDTDLSSACSSSAASSSLAAQKRRRRRKSKHLFRLRRSSSGGEEQHPETSLKLKSAAAGPEQSPTSTATTLPSPISPAESKEGVLVITPSSSTGVVPSSTTTPRESPVISSSDLPPRSASPFCIANSMGKVGRKSSRKFFSFRKRRNSSSQQPKQPKQQFLRPSLSLSESEAETDGSFTMGRIPRKASKTKPRPHSTPRTTTMAPSNLRSSTAADESPHRSSPTRSTEERCGSEDDPVVRLFEQRTTQRVRFALEGVGAEDMGPPPQQPSKPKTEASKKPSVSFSSNNNTNDNTGRLSPPASPNRKLARFMKGALFGGKSERAAVDAEVERELESVKQELVWENTATATAGGEVIRTQPGALTTTFVENAQTRAQVIKLLNKARRAQYVHFRYEYAVKCYVKALELLQQANYPQDHPVYTKTMQALDHAHNVLSSYNNSSNIVKMGIKYEDTGELVRALKMYTIAYRIRVELLGRQHPSLVVLLNMLGNIQIKRGELHEAMQIYELALKDETTTTCGTTGTTSSSKNSNNSPTRSNTPIGDSFTEGGDSQEHLAPPDPPRNLLARSATYRDMGIVYEKWGEHESALAMYHQSLDCLAKYKKLTGSTPLALTTNNNNNNKTNSKESSSPTPPPLSVDVAHDDAVSASSAIGMETVGSHDLAVHPTTTDQLKSTVSPPTTTTTATANATGGDDGMEVLVGRESAQEDSKRRVIFQASSDYDFFFPPELDAVLRDQPHSMSFQSNSTKQHQQQQQHRGDFADLDAAMTLHQIGQLHRSVGEFNLALSVFSVSLRGMKYCVGKNHPNVAAILGNIGNLQKEMGDMDSSFATYQQVLGIESYRLGLSHPDVAVTLHNIATIDAARGNHEHALALYRQVIALQRKLFGSNHVAVAVTSACMGDVYERVGEISESIACFEEAVRIKSFAMGRHSLEVARLIHKLGKLAISQGEYHLADSYVSRAILIYRLNRLSELDEWMVEATRDGADIDAAIAMGGGAAEMTMEGHNSASFQSSAVGPDSSMDGGESEV